MDSFDAADSLVGADSPLGSERVVAALDVGGTKLDAGVVDGEGNVLARHRVPTEGADGDELFEAAAGIVEASIADSGLSPAALGVGCGGPMSRADPSHPYWGAHDVSPLNIPQWRDYPLGPLLSQRFGLPVRVDNDAKALALGEGRHGAAVGERNYLAMVVSTGVGGGIVLDGRLLDGEAGNAGHVGHVIVDPRGRRCPCGSRGCLEAQISGTAIAEQTGAPAAEASTEMRRWAGRLAGRAVGSVCALLDLRLAVVAGSVALGFGADFFDAAQEELDRVATIDFARGSRIMAAGCGPDGPLLGAAAVGLELLA
ncbi:MAG: ROK family protein, partial [Microthrixaceae bacterium]